MAGSARSHCGLCGKRPDKDKAEGDQQDCGDPGRWKCTVQPRKGRVASGMPCRSTVYERRRCQAWCRWPAAWRVRHRAGHRPEFHTDCRAVQKAEYPVCVHRLRRSRASSPENRPAKKLRNTTMGTMSPRLHRVERSRQSQKIFGSGAAGRRRSSGSQMWWRSARRP